ncbi:MAG: ABC transporter permease [Gemmataceae bacterium]
MPLSFFDAAAGRSGCCQPSSLCYVDFAEESPLVTHLRGRVPDGLAGRVRFRPLGAVPTDAKGTLLYASNTAAIQLRPPTTPASGGTVWFWYPGDRGAIAAYEAWFWKETLRFVQAQRATGMSDAAPSVATAPLAEEGFALGGGMDPRSGLATALVLFGVFFLCVYLLPSLTCEERERGVLLAQALSPASTWELLAARFLFYPSLGLALAALLAGTYEPRALARPFFWMALVVCVAGSVGIGLTIATLARTQRSASMGAMAYLMAVSLVLYICQQNHVPFLPWLALEYHGPRLIHAALSGTALWHHWGSLLGAALLAVVWVVVAGELFRRRGWQ